MLNNRHESVLKGPQNCRGVPVIRLSLLIVFMALISRVSWADPVATSLVPPDTAAVIKSFGNQNVSEVTIGFAEGQAADAIEAKMAEAQANSDRNNEGTKTVIISDQAVERIPLFNGLPGLRQILPLSDNTYILQIENAQRRRVELASANRKNLLFAIVRTAAAVKTYFLFYPDLSRIQASTISGLNLISNFIWFPVGQWNWGQEYTQKNIYKSLGLDIKSEPLATRHRRDLKFRLAVGTVYGSIVSAAVVGIIHNDATAFFSWTALLVGAFGTVPSVILDEATNRLAFPPIEKDIQGREFRPDGVITKGQWTFINTLRLSAFGFLFTPQLIGGELTEGTAAVMITTSILGALGIQAFGNPQALVDGASDILAKFDPIRIPVTKAMRALGDWAIETHQARLEKSARISLGLNTRSCHQSLSLGN